MNSYIIAVDKRNLAEKFLNAVGIPFHDRKEYQAVIMPHAEGSRELLKSQGYSRIFEVSSKNASEAVWEVWSGRSINAGQREPLYQQAAKLDAAPKP